MNGMKSIKNKLVGLGLLMAVLLSGCIRGEQSPGYEYMPDMYRGPQIEGYLDYGSIRDSIRPELVHGLSVRQPPKGTVPYTDNALNDIPYTIPNTLEGYEKAGEVLKSPFPQSKELIAEGKVIYEHFCMHCHGATGQGDGPVVTNGGFPPIPSYSKQLKDLPEGKMFHTITYGKNLMGSHASQLTKTERWKVIAYVKTLQNPGAAPAKDDADNAPSDSTKTAETPN